VAKKQEDIQAYYERSLAQSKGGQPTDAPATEQDLLEDELAFGEELDEEYVLGDDEGDPSDEEALSEGD